MQPGCVAAADEAAVAIAYFLRRASSASSIEAAQAADSADTAAHRAWKEQESERKKSQRRRGQLSRRARLDLMTQEERCALLKAEKEQNQQRAAALEVCLERGQRVVVDMSFGDR
jgi:hypothetical protein